MNDKVKIESEKAPAKFELVLQVRDNNGFPTGKTKSFITDSAEELDKWYERNSGTKKNKKKKKEENKAQEKQPE
jgi:hypothetical protein